MAKSIIKKMKGMFVSKNNKSKKIPDSDSGSQAVDADIFDDELEELDTLNDKTIVEAPEASDEIKDIKDVKKEEPEIKKEKTHERVSRIAAEKNTKGYGL